MKSEQNKISSFKTNKEIFSLNTCAVITLFEIDITNIAFDQGIITNESYVPTIIISKEDDDNIGGNPIPPDPPEPPVDNPPDPPDNPPDPPEEPPIEPPTGGNGSFGKMSAFNPTIVPQNNISNNLNINTNEKNIGKSGSFGTKFNPENFTIFRFHNSINLTRSHIFWRGNKYIAAPINAEGFDLNSKGTLPTPTLSINVDLDNIETLNILKQQIKKLGGLSGAKITRIKTLSKHIDELNFVDKEKPEGFDADSNVEISRDIFYIDRKSNENKFGIEFQLASILDVEGILLPRHIVSSNRCKWSYRGFGCCYEYSTRKTEEHEDAVLPQIAPPVANINNENIKKVLDITEIKDKGEWTRYITYNKGDSVFLQKNGIKYYFVCKQDTTTSPPPDLRYWIADQCAKDVVACGLRWKSIGYNKLPIGAYPGVNKSI